MAEENRSETRIIMRKKIITLLTCSALAVSILAGCGSDKNDTTTATTKSDKQTSDTADNKSSDSSDTSDTSDASGASDETTASGIQSSESGDNKADNKVASLPEGTDSLMNISVHSLILCTADLDIKYDVSDSDYFWNAVAYAVAGYGSAFSKQTDENGNILFTTEQVKEFAASIWGGYDPSTDLPPISDTITAFSYNSESGLYSFPGSDFNSTKVVPYECTDNGDSTYSVKVKLMINDDDNLEISKWNVTIAPSTYSGSSSPIFKYKIVSFSPAS